MRVSISRAVAITLCTALLVASGALQADAFISDLLFPSDAFDISNTRHMDAKSLGNEHFFSTAIGQIPGVNQNAVQPFTTGTSIQDNGVRSSLKLPSIQTSWMGHTIAPAMDDPRSENVAMNSYEKILSRTPSASNIFKNTHLVT